MRIELLAAAWGRVFRAERGDAGLLVGLLRRLRLVRRRALERILGEAGERDRALILSDLADFCYATRTAALADNCCGRAEGEGRRQVWLRINDLLRLSERDLRILHERATAIEEDVYGD